MKEGEPTKQISVYLPRRVWLLLRAVSALQEKSMTALVQEWVEEKLAAQTQLAALYEALEEKP